MKVSESNKAYIQLDHLLFNKTASTLFKLLIQNTLQDFIFDIFKTGDLNPIYIETASNINNVVFYRQAQQVINDYTKIHTEIQKERLDNIQDKFQIS